MQKNVSDIRLFVLQFHSLPLLSAFGPALFYHFLTWGKKNFANPLKITDFTAIFRSQLLFHRFQSIILALPSIWPLVFVFSYFPQTLSHWVQRPLILKTISSILTWWKHMLKMLTMSRHKGGSFEIFIATLTSLSGGDKHHQLGVPKNQSHQNERSNWYLWPRKTLKIHLHFNGWFERWRAM